MEMPSGVNIIMLLSEGAAGLMVATSNFGKSGFALAPDAGDGAGEGFSEAASRRSGLAAQRSGV